MWRGSVTDEQDAARQRIAAWLQEILAIKGWSAETWARAAGTSGTNITRFLNGKSSFLPSATTLIKLAGGAGVAPPLVNIKASQLYIPCVNATDLRKLTAEGTIPSKALVKITQTATNKIPVEPKFGKCVAFVLDLSSLSLDGLSAGATVIVDTKAKPVAGQKVVALVNMRIGAFLYHPPHLVSRSTETIAPVDLDSALLLGVARGAVVEF